MRSEDQSALKNFSNASRTADGDRRQVLGSQDVDSSARMCTYESVNAPREPLLFAAVHSCENSGVNFFRVSEQHCEPEMQSLLHLRH